MSYLMSSLFGSPSRSTPSTPPSSPAFEEGLPPNVTRRARTPSRSFLSPKSDSLQQQQQQRIEQLEKQIEELLHENEKKDISILDLSRMVAEEREKNAILLREKQQSSSSTTQQTPVLSGITNLINDNGRLQRRMNTRGSVTTNSVIDTLVTPTKTTSHLIAEKFLKVFQDPVQYISYLQTEEFANDLIQLCNSVRDLMEDSPRVIELQSPTYVFGDIHGNLEDLHFFADNIWKLGMDLTAGHFLFLGDYVDRGMNCLEVLGYMFGLRLLYPNKITMLRGNHETRDVNGWEAHYGEKSFLYQCKARFGRELGERVWEECNLAFDRLPLAAVIDKQIFCIHGGIPRPLEGLFENEIEAIRSMPSTVSIMPGYPHEEDWMKQVGADCIWSDPASEEMERHLNSYGFGESSRGGGAVCFGNKAIQNFLQRNNLSYIIRAHEAHAHGVALSKGARVFTVFSTSKDHRQGEDAMAGCILVDGGVIQVINRSPKYKNRYVHRLASLGNELSRDQIGERIRLGLVRSSMTHADILRLQQLEAFHPDDSLDEDEDCLESVYLEG